MAKEEARKWAELYTAIAEGKTWQFQMSHGWVTAGENHNPMEWPIGRLRLKPESQRVYVATWFDRGILRHMETDVADEDGLRAIYGKLNGFRIDIIERELP